MKNFQWWQTRWHIFRSPETDVGGKFWAFTEILCAILTLSTLSLAIGLAVIRCFTPVSFPFEGWPLQIALAGAVGYGTNFVAVQMLFKPRQPISWIPLRWIWKQGLIPAKQREVAELLGDEIANRLLTPETMVEEFARLVELTLHDPSLTKQIQASIIPFAREQFPEFFERFMPDFLSALRETIRDNLPAEKVKEILLSVIQQWLEDDINRENLSDFLLDFLSSRTHPLIELIKSSVKQYQKSSKLRTLAFHAGEAINIINWNDFGQALKQQLKKPKSRQFALNTVDEFGVNMRHFIQTIVTEAWLNELKNDAGKATIHSLQEILGKALIPHLIETIHSENFQRYICEELIPALKPRLVQWSKKGYLTKLMGEFDVRGRIASATGLLDVKELEAMTNRVGAYHLGAIQVLGYLFGLLAGILMVIVDS